MKPILFPANETTFTTQGIGSLDPVSCVVTEERNGIFEVEMKISVTALHYDECVEGNILYVIHDDTKRPQPFQIYKRTKPINGVATVRAEHITYRLGMIVTEPFQSTSVADAFDKLSSNAVEDCPFAFWTDKSSEGTFEVEVPCSIRSKLGGESGSILDAFGGGEYEWDHFTVKLYQHRGHDNGVTFRRGKNVTDYTKNTTLEGVYTAIVPYYTDADGVIMLPEKFIRLDGAAAGRTVAVDLSEKFEQKPTVEQLRAAANAYLQANARNAISENAKVSFVALWQTEEYKNVAPLQRVNLCDTVTIVYDENDFVKTKVIKTVYNALLERYDAIELGEATTNMNSAIKAITELLTGDDMTKSEVQKALDHAADLITGGLGGFVVFNRNAEGQPEEILIMDTDNKETAVNVIRMNKNGIAFSKNGYNGPFTTAWTIDSRFVADFITTGTLDASRVNVTNLNASNITTGGMSANRITAGTLDASRVNVTNLNASNITAGTLSANRVRAGVLEDASGNRWNLGGGGASMSGAFTSYMGNTSSQIANGELVLRVGGGVIARIGNDGGMARLYLGDSFTVDSSSFYCSKYTLFNNRVRFNGQVQNSGGGVQFVSDRNKKKSIIDLAVEKARIFIMNLRPREYKFKDGTSDRFHHGFIAQEVYNAMEDDDWGVYTEWEEDGEKTCGIRYDEIIADLVAVVKLHERRIDQLEDRIIELENRL